MTYLVLAGIILFSSLITYQDFKTRSISVLNLIGFSLAVFFYGVMQFQLAQVFVFFLYNLCFLCFQALVLLLYYYIRYRDFKKLGTSLGGADVWVLIALAFSFDPPAYIFFISLSFVAAVIFYALMKFAFKKEMEEIPLAGIVSIFYAVFLLILSIKQMLV